jgi:hypothetical protein
LYWKINLFCLNVLVSYLSKKKKIVLVSSCTTVILYWEINLFCLNVLVFFCTLHRRSLLCESYLLLIARKQNIFAPLNFGYTIHPYMQPH